MQYQLKRLQGAICKAVEIICPTVENVDSFMLSVGIDRESTCMDTSRRINEMVTESHLGSDITGRDILGSILYVLYRRWDYASNMALYNQLRNVQQILSVAGLKYIAGGRLTELKEHINPDTSIDVHLSEVKSSDEISMIASETRQNALDAVSSYFWLNVVENRLRDFILSRVTMENLPASQLEAIEKSKSTEKRHGWVPLRVRTDLEYLYLHQLKEIILALKDDFAVDIADYGEFIVRLDTLNRLRRQVMHSCFLSSEMQEEVIFESKRLLRVLHHADENRTRD